MHTSSTDAPAFVAGLDGLRALAVIAVLAFHLEWSGASGGFLGVSLFFTLSGFLITRLLIRERKLDGGIDVRAFWVRRLRRLMPAALIVVSAVAIAALAFGRFASERLRGDLFAALGYSANWRFMAGSASYSDLFTTTPSPVLHFWSLAIEEQFYIVFPLLMSGLLALRRRWIVPAGLAGLALLSVGAGLLTSSQDVVYYGAHTRAVEILAGALLAMWFPLGGFERSREPGPALLRSRVANTFFFGGVLGLFVVLVAIVETGDDWLYSGGLAAFSLVSVVLIVAVQSPGPIRWLAERKLAVGIGELSYGLYLFHWPVFRLVTEESTPLSGWAVNVVRLVVTCAAAWISARFLERPIRTRRLLTTKRTSLVALGVTVATTATLVAFVPRTPTEVLAGLDAPDGFVTFDDAAARPRVKILVLGSEPSEVKRWTAALEDDYDAQIVDGTDPLCPLGAAPGCADPAVRIDAAIGQHRPDIVVAAFGSLDRRTILESVGELVPDDPAFFDATRSYVDAIVRSVPTTPTIVVDLGPADALRAFLEDADIRQTNVSVLVAPSAADIQRTVSTVRSIVAGDDDRQRVMVIGDSTSYGISVAIDELEGDRLNVLWAGGQNCPLVEVEAVRWWEGVEFDLQRCPSLDGEWRAAFASFEPSLVVVAVSVPEQADQRYPGAPEWSEPGSAEYRVAHDEFIDEFMAEVTARGIDVLVLDSPAIHGGALSGAPFSSAERIAEWNSVISRWSQLWPDIVVVPWAAAMASFEPAPGSLREDGVHLRQEDLDDLVAQALLPTILSRLFPQPQNSTVEAESQPVE